VCPRGEDEECLADKEVVCGAEVVVISAVALPSGSTVIINVEVTSEEAMGEIAEDSIGFALQAVDPVMYLLAGNELSIGDNAGIVENVAKTLYLPCDDPVIIWTCTSISGDCPCPSSSPQTSSTLSVDYTSTSSSTSSTCTHQWLASASCPPTTMAIVDEEFIVTLLPSKTVSVTVSSPSCRSDEERVLIQARVWDEKETIRNILSKDGDVIYRWTSSLDEDILPLSSCDSTKSSCPLLSGGNDDRKKGRGNSSSLVLYFKKGALPPGEPITFTLTSYPIDEDGSITSPTLGGYSIASATSCVITPPLPPFNNNNDGCGFVTTGDRVAPLSPVEFVCEGWQTPEGDGALLYQYFYYLEGEWYSYGDPTIFSSVTTYPPYTDATDGKWEVRAEICTSRGACVTPEKDQVKVEDEKLKNKDYNALLEKVASLLTTTQIEEAGNLLVSLLIGGGRKKNKVKEKAIELIYLSQELSVATSGGALYLPRGPADQLLQEALSVCDEELFRVVDTVSDALDYDVSLFFKALECTSRNNNNDERQFQRYLFISERAEDTYTRNRGYCGVPVLDPQGAVWYSGTTTTLAEMNQEDTVLRIEEGGIEFTLPKGFGDVIVESLRDDGFALGLEDGFCIGLHRTEWTDQCLASSLSTPISGMTLRVGIPTAEGTILSREIRVQNLPDNLAVLIAFPPEKRKKDNNKRLSLTDDKEVIEEEVCVFQVGGCDFSREGCVADGVDERGWKVCKCVHLSNFGLLFTGGEGQEEWTTYRIISIALLGGVWVLLGLFMLLVTVSRRFQVMVGAETAIAKDARVLGDHSPY